MQLKEDPLPPSQVNAGINPQIERVIFKALEKDPIRRYRSVGELKRDLEAAVMQPATAQVSNTAEAKTEFQQIK